jgi:predicted dehydrogenase
MDTPRRTFLAAAAGAPALRALQGSPGDRIRIGLIGAGGRGLALFNDVRRSGENAAIVAVCDVWRLNREAMAAQVEKAFGAAPKQTTRYRELLAMKDVDAVLIATPDVGHPWILIDAVAADKDVYVEKPFAIDLDGATKAYAAVKRSRQVVQVGTNRRSEPGLIGAAAAVRSGALGKITRVDMEVHFQEPRWARDYSMVKAEDVDWEAFCLGGRIQRPFDARLFRQWQLFRETTNGIPGLWMCHYIDEVPWFLGMPYPDNAVALGGVYLWKDGRQTADVFQAMFEYHETLVTFAMSLTNAAGGRDLWFGTRGTLDAKALKITGEGSRAPDRIVDPVQIETQPVESHMANFLRSVRSRQTPRASVEAGFSHAVAGCMAAASLETGRRVLFDAAKLEMR